MTERQRQYGKNEIPAPKGSSLLEMIIEQFKETLVSFPCLASPRSTCCRIYCALLFRCLDPFFCLGTLPFAEVVSSSLHPSSLQVLILLGAAVVSFILACFEEGDRVTGKHFWLC